MARLRLLVLVWGFAAVPASAASPDPKDLTIPPHELSRAEALVRQLSSDTFRDRERAQRELAVMGRLARPVLAVAAQTDPDPEVRSRCSRLLPKATADDLKARTDVFLADAEGRFEHDLPGWKRFREVVGADQPGRDLFVELLKSGVNGELLAAVDRPAAEAGRAVSDRRNQMYAQITQRQFRPIDGSVPPPSLTLADVAALLFAEVAVPSKNIPRVGQLGFAVTGASFVQQPAALSAVTTDTLPHATAYRRILSKWLDTRTDPADLSHYALVNVAFNLRTMKESVPLLRRVVQTEGVQGYQKAQAMLYLVQRNGKDELPVIKSQLTNDSALSTQRVAADVNITCQVRDVALALCIHHSGRQMKDYGYDFVNGFNPAQVTSNYWGYGFAKDEKRDAAFKKWQQFEATSPPAKK
jgi:hypothetical protein